MFHHIRYAIGILFIAVLFVGTGTYYYIGHVAERSIHEEALRTYQSVEQRFRTTLWPKHKPVLEKLHTLPEEEWERYREFAAFRKDILAFFHATPVAGIVVYTPRGTPLFASDKSLLSSSKSRLIEHYAQSGGSTHILYEAALLQNNNYTAYDALVRNVRSFKSHAGDTLFIVETLQDMTMPIALWNWLRWFVTGVVAIIFLTMVLILLATTRRAEHVIEEEFQEKEKLIEFAKSAEEENRNKSRFLAHISHELRTPLNAIIGFSEILNAESTTAIPGEQHRSYIKDIHNSGVHLLSLINDILDYSKAEAGKLELENSQTNITKLIINCMRLVTPRADGVDVTLVHNLPETQIAIDTDAKKLRQIMLNLLSNAVKFTLPGGEVHVGAWKNTGGDKIFIEVRDTGIGIAPENIARALSPFEQVDNALSRKYEGTGLGLPLTKKLVELMGGQFTLKSEVDVGTTITFSLPGNGGTTNEHAHTD